MAMDYETPRGTENEPNTNELVPEIAAIAAAAAQAGATPLVPGPDNVVVLPAGVTLDDIAVQGRDLVITLDNGQVFIIPEGAIYVPQIVVDGVAVPPMNLAALLNGIEGIEGEEFNPEAGPTRSSGGNFADPVNPIGPAFGLGDLLPYTELAFPEQPPREVIPGRPDRPINLALSPGNQSVDEAGLPARGAEPAGSNAAANSETTTGTINVNAPDGILSVTINGTAITAVGQTVTTARGVLTITGISPSGSYTYSYTLSDNTSGDNTSDTFNVVATDTDGDVAVGTITIGIVDDVPTARNDTDAVTAGTYGPESGNVMTGAGTTSGSAGADTQGADAATVTGFRAGTSGAFGAVGSTIAGTYGTLTINAAGTYTYTRNAGTPGGVNDVFSYQLTDGDGDTSTATLTIAIADALPITSANAVVLLDDDALAGGNPGGTGDDVNAANVTGTLGASGGDGPLAWSLSTTGAPAGFSYVANGTGIDVFQGATKVLTVTLNTATGAYTVTQVAPIVHVAGSDENNQGFTLSYQVTDVDGDAASGNLTISVDDDTPVVRDSASTGTVDEDGLAGGNAGGTGDVAGTATTATGSVAGLFSIGADGLGSYSLASSTAALTAQGLTSGGVALTYSVAGNVLTASAGATPVFTLTLNAATGAWNFDLLAKLDQPVGGNENDISIQLGSMIIATDKDGDSVTASGGALTVVVDDDTPVAGNDTDTVASGTYGPETGNVLTGAGTTSGAAGADSIGADGAAVGGAVTAITGAAAGTVGGTTAGTYGTLTLNADGSYSYVRNAGTPGGVSDVFTYTVTDRDGDSTTATLTINIADALPVTAANGAVLLDDDALAGGNAGGTGDDVDSANATGFLAGSGGDGPLIWQAVSFTSPIGFTPTLVNPGLVEVRQGATLVFTIAFNTATGAYTVTQVAPITHPAGSNENNTGFSFGYRVIDQDGDTANGSISINIDDDSPIAVNDTDSVAAGTYGPETGNVLTGLGTTSGAAGADSIGADGPAAGGAVTAVSGAAAGTIGGATNGTYGVLTLNADGSYSYVRNAGTPGGVSDVFTYTITDKDGDSTTATLTISIGDAQPLTGQNATVLLDDDALAGGNAGGTGDDVNAANLTGTLSASGGDGPLSWAMNTTGAPAGFSYVANGTGIDVFQGTTLVMQVTLNTATGAYTVTQVAPIEHVSGSGENNASFTIGYTVTDQDGDPATGSITINVDDDTPVAANDTDTVASGTYGPETGNVVTGIGTASGAAGADSLGADGAAAGGAVTAITGAAAGTIGGTTAGTYGVLTMNADGSYSYVRNAGTPGGVSDVFTYTITDKDGDSTTATLTINIDDARPVTAANGAVLLDDDALAGGNAGGTGDDVDSANATGFLAGSGGDGPLTWQAVSFTSPVGFVPTLVNPGLIEVRQGATLVYTIAFNTTTGAYTVTQLAPIHHPAGGDENNTGFSFAYRVVDQDGDFAVGSISINIDDDTPVVSNDTDSLLAGATGPATGNVLTDASAGDAGDTDTGADSLGADGGSVTAITGFGGAGVIGGTTTGQYGTLTLNADGSYSYTRSGTAPLSATDTFTYTVTDGDGDTATATLTITIEDAGPVTGKNVTVLLDDDALAGGNAGGTGDDVDASSTSGTLAGSGGDGALAWALATTGAPAGFSYVANGTGIDVFQGATKVLAITLNTATGAYTVTQVAPIVHAAGADENNQSFTLDYTVTDADGDGATGSFSIDVDDDSPIAVNDTDMVASGTYGPETGNVLTGAGTTSGAAGADSLGADGPAAGGAVTAISGAAAGTIGGTTTGTYGVLTMNADGSYSYVRNAGTPAGVDDVFTYTVTDKDGDTATATLTITIEDARPVTGPNAAVLLDDDALAGGNPGGTGDDPDAVNVTGTLAGSGGDGPLVWQAVSFTSPAGFTPTLVNPGLVEVRQGATLVFTIQFNTATGAYTITQVAPISHVAGNNENNTSFSFAYRVIDQDGDTANGSISINIDDDTPTVTSNALVQLDDDVLGGNAGGAGDDVNSANAIGTLGHSFGADGAGSLAFLTTGAPAGFSYVANGTGIDVFQGTTKVLTVTLNTATGAYTVVQNAPIVHEAGNDENNQAFTLSYTVTDKDGDTVTGTLDINVDDDTPIALVTSFGATVDEDGLAGGNPGGTGDAAATLPSASGSVTGLFSVGADVPLTYSLGTSTAGLPALSSGGVALTYSVAGNVLTASAGATPVFTFTLNATTGAWDFVLLAPLDHAPGGNENDILIDLGEMVIATDNDGDSVQAVGNLIITVDDDTPVAGNDSDTVASGTYGPETGNVLTGAGTTSGAAGADSIGADGPATGGAVTAITGAAAGTIGGTTAGTYGTLTLNADGSYSYVRNAGTPGGVSDVFTYTITDKDGDSTTATLTINIADALPVTAANGAVQLDDDAQAGGNPGGIGDDPDAVNVTGTLAGSGGDGPLTWTAVSFSSPGGFTASLVNPGLVEVRQGATLVMTIAINNATGAYTVTQVAPIDHAALGDENNANFTFGYRVTDVDGDNAFGTLSINVDDDTPVVANDTDSLLAGATGPATGNVLTDADAGDAGDTDTGADSLGADGGSVTAISGFGGAGTVGGTTTGQYGTLTLNADGSYSYTRSTSSPLNATDTFTYTVTDGDGDTATATLTITIADAGPVTGANLTVLLDDDAQAGGNPGGVGDDVDSANATGFLAGSGGDGALTWTAVSFSSPGGFSATLVNPGLVEVYQGATLVMTIAINNATGAYTVTQVAPIDHPAGLDENNSSFTFGYRVTDADGDQAFGTLSINVDDDTPVVSNDTDSLLAGATGPATGNVLTDAAPGDAGDSDTGADSLGADGGSVTGITGFGGAGTIGGTTTGQYGTLTLNADGSYSYTRSGTGPLNATDTFTYTVTDGDGDTATATLTITIEDAGPVTGANLTVLLDDDAQAGGNAGGTGDDVDSANATGFLAGSGGDGALTWTAVSFSSPGGFTASLVNPGLVEVRQGATLVMTIAINNATGAYTVTQVAPIDHPAGLDENNSSFTFGYRVEDADGDVAFGTLGINIDDDTPVVSNDTDSLLAGATGPATGNVLTDADAGDAGDTDTGADSLGADGGSVTAISGSGGAGTIGGTTTGTHGTLTMNADGSYSYTRSGTGPLSATDTFTYTVTDGDGDTATATLTITIEDAGPVTGANLTVLLDDDAQAGGNPGGTGDDVDSANATGFLAGSGGDGALTWTAVSFSSPGGFTASLVNPGLVEVRQGTTLVMTVAINNATGAYTVTQVAPIDHPAGLDENNSSFTFGYRVEDADGDVAFGTIGINIDDDTPVVSNDTDSLLAGATGPATGNVLTDAAPGDAGDSDTGADSLGADGGSVTAVASVNVPANIDTTLDGSNNLVVAGQHGTLTLNADGTYSYLRNSSTPLNATDTFTYTVTDGDGDTATATLTITIADAGPVTAANGAVQLDDDALAGGNAGGTGDDPNAVNVTGFLAGSGGDGALTWTAVSFSSPAGFSATLVNPGLIEVRQGTTLVMTIAINNATGAYTVTQVAPISHPAGLDENNSSFTFGYRVEDADGDPAFGTLSINVDDDTPVVSNDTDALTGGSVGPATGNVLTDAAPGDAGDTDTGADSLGADGGSVTAITGFGGAGTIGGTTTGQYGTLTMNADGSYSYTRSGSGGINATDTFTYTVTDGDGDTATATLTITLTDTVPVTGANLTVLLDDDALTGGIAGGTGDTVDAQNTSGTLAASGGDGALTWAYQTTGAPAGFTYVANGTGVDVFQGATKVLVLTLNTATGGYNVSQVAAIKHATGSNENNQAFTINYTATDADGDAAAGTLSISVNDDSPIQVVPTAISLVNAAGAPVLASLDANLLNNYGADGGTPRFSPTLNGTNSGLTNNSNPIIYTVSPDGLSLIGKVGATTIFTVTLLPGTNQYSVDIDQPVDSLTTLNFASGAYQFVGGNTAWVGFVPLGQDTTGGAINDNSKDLMITPSIGGVFSGTINGSSVALGVGSGNAVDPGEMVRLDFVTDLTGNTAGPGGYGTAANRDHVFDGHYSTNGASALITATAGSTVKFTAKDDFDANLVVGDGTIDPITKIVIAYNSVASSFIIPTTTLTNYTVNGITYGVKLNADGSVSISNVQGTSGAGAIGTQVAVYTGNGYSSLEIAHEAGANFKLGNFGTVVQSTNPVNFTVPVEVIDGDGDVSASANIAITLTAAPPPVALDLDGNGVQFLSLADGVTFDYNGDGSAEQTAWVGGGDGLLAIDRNGDGLVNDGSEIVFGGSGQTDLEGLAAQYDSNKDGVLDANDAAFAQFAVWQDADSDGLTDAGELRSLTDMGIASISLTSDGQSYNAAGGDVAVAGSSTYTRADGSVGTVADAAFAIIEQARQAARSNELAGVAAATGGFLASTALAAAMPASDGHQAEASQNDVSVPQAEAVDAGLAPAAGGSGFDSAANLPIHDPAPQLETAGHDWADGLADALARIDMAALSDRIAEMGGANGNADRFDAIADAIGGQFAIGSGSLQAMDALLIQGGNGPVMAINPQDLPALETAFGDTVGDHLVDAIVDHFAANDAGPGNWVAPASDFALQGLLDTAVGDSPNLNLSGVDMARMMFQSTELAETSHG